jgi:hypothetical protein
LLIFNKWFVDTFEKKMKVIFCLLFVASIALGQNNIRPFWGNLHSHTSYSDGVQSPYDAFVYAKDVAGLDFLAVTDHMEQLSSTELSQCQNFAAFTTQNGVFVSICGYEWSSPYYGHVNVFNTSDMPSVFTYTDWSGFRQWMINHPNALAQFNHPGDESYFNNWYNFEYKGAATDSAFPLIEFQSVQQANDWYELALNNGWHLSPVWNQDNHSADWGTKNTCRAGIWAQELTYNDLIQAMRKGRTFATMDKNAAVLLQSGNMLMGAIVNRQYNMPFRILLVDSNNEAYTSIQLRSSNGNLLTLISTGNNDTTLYLTLYTEKYIYIKATQADGDILWSAPIYLDGTISANQPTDESPFLVWYYDEHLHLKSPVRASFRCSIINILGQTVYQSNIDASVDYVQIPISLNKGVYSIVLENSNLKYQKKIVR